MSRCLGTSHSDRARRHPCCSVKSRWERVAERKERRMNTQENGMTNAEYEKAIAEIVASGRGYDALSDILKEVTWRNDLFHKMYDEQRACLRAIHKIANSMQTASQKIKGIRELSDVEGEE
jgi:hypothetical protein